MSLLKSKRVSGKIYFDPDTCNTPISSSIIVIVGLVTVTSPKNVYQHDAVKALVGLSESRTW